MSYFSSKLRALAAVVLLFSISPIASATNHFTRINEVMAGLNGDSGIQFIEIVANGHDQKAWGPQFGENVGRAMLVFFDEKGNRTGRFVVPSDPDSSPTAATTVLFATQAFASLSGIAPDFIIPPSIMPNAGRVCLNANPDNPSAFPIEACLTYGGSAFTGSIDGAGAPNPATLSILGAQSLTRIIVDPFGSFGTTGQLNSDFALRTPTPASTKALQGSATQFALENNLASEAALPVAITQELQGRNLFFKETFRGNGRTCASCHVEKDGFALTPSTVATLPATDPLFIHESNINVLVVSSSGSINPTSANGTQPSDFRIGGTITGAVGGSGRVLAGTGNTYLVVGGQGLNIAGQVITDSAGNKGTLVSFTAGNLQGPSPVSGLNEGLENSTRLRGARALITENIDGFSSRAVMRGSPNLMNVKFTAPYGLSGGIPNLQEFSRGAVTQHFPRRLERVAGVDFREPTTAELQALEAFQNTIVGVKDQNFDELNNFARFATTEAQKRGRDLFFGEAKCGTCHSGKALNISNGLLGTQAGVNQNFNTGVVLLPANLSDAMPTEESLGQPANSRTFNTPTLFGIRNTQPFFHDNSAPTLAAAIAFYDSPQFRNSPANLLIGNIDAVALPAKAQDLLEFLEALIETPFTFTSNVDFSTVPNGTSVTKPAVVSGTTAAALTIAKLQITGPDASLFQAAIVAPLPGGGGGGSGGGGIPVSTQINISFKPITTGAKNATLEIDVSDGTQIFKVGVALTGIGAAIPVPDIQVDTASVAFANQSIDAGAGTAQTLVISNLGTATANLVISAVSLVGANAAEFVIAADSGQITLAPGAVRSIQVAFDPISVGAKVATLRITSNDPDEASVDIPLSGTGTAPEITLTPLSAAFGTRDIKAGASTSSAFVIRNDGSAPLAINSVSLTGVNSLDFVIVADTGQTSLAPAATRIVSIAFDPASTGSKSAALRIVSNDANEAITDLPLTGTGSDPEIVISPLTAAFGNQAVAAGPTAPQLITISNIGTTPLTLSVAAFGVNIAEFLVNNSAPATLNPGASATLSVAFDPSFAGNKSATLRISSNDFDESLVDIPLSGIGVAPEITVIPISLSFGSQDVAAGPTLNQTVTIRNDGTANLTISSIGFFNNSGGDFVIKSDSGQTALAPGTARNLQIAFDPATTGSKAATLSIISDDSDEAQVLVSLLGTAFNPEVAFNTLSLAFGTRNVDDGPTAAQTVIVTNVGLSTLSLTAVALAGPDAAHFKIVSDSAQTSLAPGAARNVVLAFDPASGGTKSVSLLVASNDFDEGTTLIQLSGTGNTAPLITAQKPVITPPGVARTLTLADLTVTDNENIFPTGFTLTVQDGLNYTRLGNVITPAVGFIGKLTVPVTVSDGTASSAVFNFSVTVTNDRDGDGVPDTLDAFPDNPGESVDTDGDGIGNNADTDDDNDGLTDQFEITLGTNPLKADTDGDSITDQQELTNGTDPRSADTDKDGLPDNVDTQPLVDNNPPVILLPANRLVDSTGESTAVDIGQASALDAHDGILVATPSTAGPFPAGHNVVVWSATDVAGNKITATQSVDVRPRVTITVVDLAAEGGKLMVVVGLNGNAINYPVTVPYSVSGTATPGVDHSAMNGTFIIDSLSQNRTQVEFDVVSDGLGDAGETVTFTLGSPTGAVLGTQITGSATIIEENFKPVMSFEPTQDGQGAITAASINTGGDIQITSVLSNVTFGDWLFDWSGSDPRLIDIEDNNASTLRASVASLIPGIYKIAVRTTSNNNLPQVSGEAQMYLRVVRAFANLSSETDSDGDGLSDAVEGEGDADGDGVADYLDNIAQRNVLQTAPGKLQRTVVADTAGLLQLGTVAFDVGAAQVNGAQIVVHYAQGGRDPLPYIDTLNNTGGYVDVQVVELASGSQPTRIVVPQTSPIPANAVLRLLDPVSGWRDFTSDATNSIASARSTDGVCPLPVSGEYQNGLSEGFDCVLITLTDNGPNDIAVGVTPQIAFLGGVAQGRQQVVPNDSGQEIKESNGKSGGGGGSFGFELIVLALLLNLSLRRRTLRRLAICGSCASICVSQI